MSKKRNSLFPNELSALFTSEHQPDVKSSLFGLVDDETALPPPPSPVDILRRRLANASPISVINSLGGNLHQLKHHQILRLISVKYSNDPILLIKQLSVDLAKKESDLILERQEAFIREQKLLKLCNDYGNLSTMEIDTKLAEMDESPAFSTPHHDDVDEIIKDMIETAVNQDLAEPSRKPTVPAKAPEEQLLHKSSSKSWLTNWFNSSEDLTIPSAPRPRRPHSRSFPLNFRKSNSEVHLPRTLTALPPPVKAPVELHSIKMGGTSSTDLQSLVSDSANIDKYGFFQDMDHIVKEKPQPQQPPSEIDNSAILIGNKDRQTIDHLMEISKIHDSTNRHYEELWETLIQDINRDYYRLLKKGGEETSDIFGTRGLKLLNIDNGVSHYNRLVNLTSNFGIPPKYRHRLWLELSGATNLRINGRYQELLQEIKNASRIDIQNNIEQINLDLHRTLPWNYYFNNLIELKPGPNFYKLQRILYAFVAYRPEIGYYQGMNKIVGNLLLIMSLLEAGDAILFDEEDMFWIFIGLIDEILPKYTHGNGKEQVFFTSLSGIRTDQSVMYKNFFRKHLPQLARHFQRQDIEVELITMNWWLTLFIDLKFMDLDTWFKVFDSLLVGEHIELSENNVAPRNKAPNNEQNAVKLVVLSLVLFKCLEVHLLNLNSKDEIYQFLSSNNNRRYEVNDSGKFNIKYADFTKYKLRWTIRDNDLRLARASVKLE